MAIGWEDNENADGRADYKFICKKLTHHLKRLCKGEMRCPAPVVCHMDELIEPEDLDQIGDLEVEKKLSSEKQLWVYPKDESTQVVSCGTKVSPFLINKASVGCRIDLVKNACSFWNYTGREVELSCNAFIEFRKI